MTAQVLKFPTRVVSRDVLQAARSVLRQGLVSVAGAVLGFVLLVALFKLGLFHGIDVLFYRGVAICFVAVVATVALMATIGRRLGGVTLADALSVGVLSLGLNLSFLVIAPVTVDRSVSVFILAYMAEHRDETLTTGDIDAAFRRIYLGDMAQVDRRMREQTLSGTVQPVGDGYRIAPGGLAFLRTARAVAWMFDTDTKLLDAGRAR